MSNVSKCLVRLSESHVAGVRHFDTRDLFVRVNRRRAASRSPNLQSQRPIRSLIRTRHCWSAYSANRHVLRHRSQNGTRKLRGVRGESTLHFDLVT